MIDYLVFYHFGDDPTVHTMTVRAYTSDHARGIVEDHQWDNYPVVDKVEPV